MTDYNVRFLHFCPNGRLVFPQFYVNTLRMERVVICVIRSRFRTNSRIATLDGEMSEALAMNRIKKRVRNHGLDQEIKTSRTHCYED